jgi:hypothetical protein
MSQIAIRPRFRLPSSHSPDELIQKIKNALETPDAPIKGTIIDHHIILRIPLNEQHYWSPQLDLDIESQENGSQIKGLFGPRPSVWFMYVFFYSLMAFISSVVAIMGFSQLNLGLSAKILWILPLMFLLFIFAYSTARAGQKLGLDEMIKLYDFLVESIGYKENKHQ